MKGVQNRLMKGVQNRLNLLLVVVWFSWGQAILIVRVSFECGVKSVLDRRMTLHHCYCCQQCNCSFNQ